MQSRSEATRKKTKNPNCTLTTTTSFNIAELRNRKQAHQPSNFPLLPTICHPSHQSPKAAIIRLVFWSMAKLQRELKMVLNFQKEEQENTNGKAHKWIEDATKRKEKGNMRSSKEWNRFMIYCSLLSSCQILSTIIFSHQIILHFVHPSLRKLKLLIL